jgi:hypothetical protein
MSYQNLIDAIDTVLSWNIPDEQFGDAVQTQAGLLAGISPDDIGECSLD